MRFEVRSNYRLYLNLQTEITELDKELDPHFTDHTKGLEQPATVADPTVGRQKLRQSRNTPQLPIEQYAHKLLRVDLSNIPGFGRDALLTFMAEVGESISKFHSAKAFAKWLGFTPNNKASGGKVLSRKTLKNKSTLPNTFASAIRSDGCQLAGQHEEAQSDDGFLSADCIQGWSDQSHYGDGAKTGGGCLQDVDDRRRL